ncbi:uncharacterized protein LOC114021190 [Chelonia mydas]|uniref:uncharacterized protein LOC114021190 n=1 Tax=Chelonia mydas TaxID=8469 RepID=UPI0018A2042C|nr:uncharacterized protein LOC114021190 [Chelonia mydas]
MRWDFSAKKCLVNNFPNHCHREVTSVSSWLDPFHISDLDFGTTEEVSTAYEIIPGFTSPLDVPGTLRSTCVLPAQVTDSLSAGYKRRRREEHKEERETAKEPRQHNTQENWNADDVPWGKISSRKRQERGDHLVKKKESVLQAKALLPSGSQSSTNNQLSPGEDSSHTSMRLLKWKNSKTPRASSPLTCNHCSGFTGGRYNSKIYQHSLSAAKGKREAGM